MDRQCNCGRIWRVTYRKFRVRVPGAIICKCGEDIARWHGSRASSVELVQGLPEDDGQPVPYTCE